MERLDMIISAAKQLNQNELEELSSKLLTILNSYSADKSFTGKCQRCGGNHTIKYGKDKNGKQKYKCNDCNTVFSNTSYTVVSKTHHDMSTWKKYVECLLQGVSLVKCAHACKISVQTAFVWRHKILNALQKDQDNRLLGGIVETDDTYIGISYKGNHKKSKTFTMPRKSFKRGTDSRAQIGSKACVMCAFERNGQSYVEVLGKGQPTIAMLSHSFSNRILPESIVISDKAIGIKNYFKNNNKGIQLIQLQAHIRPKNMNDPPEVKGAFHIQNINNMHYRIKKFLQPYNGVSTKYLNHYMNLFAWIENHKKEYNTTLQKSLINTLSIKNTYIPFEEIVKLPPIPVVA